MVKNAVPSFSHNAPEAVARCEDVGVGEQRSSALVVVTTTIPDLKKGSIEFLQGRPKTLNIKPEFEQSKERLRMESKFHF